MRKDILLIEESEEAGQAAVNLLRAFGYRATLASTDADVRRRLVVQPPCVILIGALSPVRTRELIKLLRRQHRGIPAVMLATSGNDWNMLASPESDALVRIVDRFCGDDASRAAAN